MTKVRFDAELIERYGGRGPRYTSYPTAPQFHEGFCADDYRRHAAASNTGGQPVPLSLYLHLPFCRSLCYYCGCNKFITRSEERAQDYLQTLQQEAAMHSPLYAAERTVEQLHLGGGTPTFYADEQLAVLMDTLRRCFRFASGDAMQCSVEVDPRTVGPERIAALAELGFNRLSLGVQDFDGDVQRAVNRVQSEEDTLALLSAARSKGFRSVSVDLIYGLPKQTPAGFERTLATVAAARPDRISLYSYAHMPQLFRSQKLIKREHLPGDRDKLALLELSVAYLCAAGYEYIGMDHFALATDELVHARESGHLQRNFQGYSTHADCDLISLGASAIGTVAGSFYQNHKTTKGYVERVQRGELPIVRGLELDADDIVRADAIQALMCQGRLAKGPFGARHGLSFDQYFAGELRALEPLADDGLVVLSDEEILVTASGQLLLRPIAMVFDRYLQAAAPVRYSKVI